MKFGVALGALNPHFHLDATAAAEALGYESVWLPEHLVLPVQHEPITASGRGPPAGPTDRARLRRVHLPRLPRRPVPDAAARHARLQPRPAPPVRRRTRRADARRRERRTLSSSGSGRAGSRRSGSRPGSDFRTRGRRVDEALAVCKRLWSEPEVEHHGEFFDFDAVAFEPKPVQRPWPPILVGGESTAALRRAALRGGRLDRHGPHVRVRGRPDRTPAGPAEASGTPTTSPIGRSRSVSVGPSARRDDVKRWEEIGVTRLVVAPWSRSPEAVDGLERYADLVGLTPR